MPEKKIIYKPGIDSQATQTLNNMGWWASNLIRWKAGYLEKLGGWTKLCNTAVVGIARGLHGFSDLMLNSYLAIGTNSRLQIFWQGAIYDITPIRATNDLTAPFSTTSGQTAVNVEDTANGTSVGDWVEIVVPVSVGGIVLQGFYAVTAVTDSDNYTIEAASSATSTVSGGGATPKFDTTNGSATVTVTLANHGYTVGQTFTVQLSTIVGGLTLSGDYLVITVPTANTFTIGAASTAGSTATVFENGGDAQITYLLASGPVSDTALIGWGTGTYGTGFYGISSGSAALAVLRNWFLDNFGQDLLAVPTNLGLYVWQPPVESGNVATIVATAPIYNAGMFVAMPQRQVVLLGSETGMTQDPMLIRYSDIGDYTVWDATTTNQAGSFRLSRGSNIVGGCQAPQAGLIWTDTDLWAMQYIGFPLVYSFSIIGSGCGLVAAKAFSLIGKNCYWMSLKGFFTYGDAGVGPVICPVWDKVFADLDIDNATKCFAADNSQFNEVSFFYPSRSGNTAEIDRYVKLNVAEGLWDYGSLVRTAWADETPFGPPIGVDGDGYLQQHETSANADGDPMTGNFVESGYADIADGTLFMFVDQIIPDIYLTGTDPSVTITVYATDYPGTTAREFGPYTVTSSTQYISLRTRARQLAFKVECDSLDTFWRIGAIRYRGAPAGRR